LHEGDELVGCAPQAESFLMPPRHAPLLLLLLAPVATAHAAGRHEHEPAQVEWAWPLDGRITSHFGPRDGRHHDGIDITTRPGRPVHAAGQGRVTMAGENGGYGLFVEIEHGDGHTTRYGHLDALWVRRGQWVEVGTPLGPMGSTGHVTGPHLHFEVYEDGEPVDPAFLAIPSLADTEEIVVEEIELPAPPPTLSPATTAATAGILPVAQQLLSVLLAWWAD
jgi:murein DD-endopeptidase MepM/ murein hydrolase activator NlpD